MISPIKLFSLKFKNLKWNGNEWRWVLILTAVALVGTLGVSGLMWLVVAYVIYGLLSKEG